MNNIMDRKTFNNNVLVALDMIKNGIEENGIKREFDLLDYNMLFSNKYFDEINKYDNGIRHITNIARKMLSSKDYILFKRSICKYQAGVINNERIIDYILEDRTEYDCKKDENGNLIKGTGYTVSQEIKEKIINYLINNNIPTNIKTYKVALKRYLNNTLVMEEDKKYTLNKS